MPNLLKLTLDLTNFRIGEFYADKSLRTLVEPKMKILPSAGDGGTEAVESCSVGDP